MHIPSEMLSGAICPITAAISTIGIGASIWAISKSKNTLPSAGKFALVSAAIFGMQMLNYPIWDGISGHLIGGIFAAALLGTPAAVMSVALVLILQTILFADGGILMLGANILNMSILGAGIGGLTRQFLINKKLSQMHATALAAFISVEIAVLALCTELFLSGKGSLNVYATLIGVHSFLGVLEAVATILLLSLVGKSTANQTNKRTYLGLGGIVLGSLLIAPFASAYPDAFEWTMEKFALLPDSPNFVNAPFADYALSSISHEMLSSFSAGLIGVLATMIFGYIVCKVLSFSKATKV